MSITRATDLDDDVGRPGVIGTQRAQP